MTLAQHLVFGRKVLVGHALFIGGAAIELATVLLETVLLAHAAAFLGGLHLAAGSAKRVELAVEELIFAELAVERAVVEGNFETRLQADGFKAFFLVTDNPSLVAAEGMFQRLADHLIKPREVFGLEAFAVWRVGHHDRLLGRLLKLLEVALLQGYDVAHACSLHVGIGCLNGTQVKVVAVNLMVEGTLLRVVVVNLL